MMKIISFIKDCVSDLEFEIKRKFHILDNDKYQNVQVFVNQFSAVININIEKKIYLF